MNYEKIYNDIISNRIKNKYEGYTEAHHIVPKCMGGINSEENLVNLSGREHYICHLLLTKIYPKNYKLKYSYNNMFMNSTSQNRYTPISLWYEHRRQLFSENHPMKNENTRMKLSNSVREYYKHRTRCRTCYSTIDRPKIYCDDVCENNYENEYNKRMIKKGYIKCLVCNVLHNNKYYCSNDCKNKHIKNNDEYKKVIKLSMKEWAEANKKDIKEKNINIAKKVDQEKKGKKISETKRIKGIGNGFSSSKVVYVYNSNSELVHISEKSFKHFCIEHNLPERRLKYRIGKPLKNNPYKGWYITYERK